MAEHVWTFITFWTGSPSILVFLYKYYGEMLTVSLNGKHWMQVGCDFRPISCSVLRTMQDTYLLWKANRNSYAVYQVVRVSPRFQHWFSVTVPVPWPELRKSIIYQHWSGDRLWKSARCSRCMSSPFWWQHLKSGRCAVELYHASHLWYPLFYTSPMAFSALQHWTASPTKEGCHWQAGGENRQTWQLANAAWYT